MGDFFAVDAIDFWPEQMTLFLGDTIMSNNKKQRRARSGVFDLREDFSSLSLDLTVINWNQNATNLADWKTAN